MRKIWGIIVLIIWFLWLLGRNVMSVLSWGDSMDMAIYSGQGLTPLFFVMATGAFDLELSTLFFLFRPARMGLWLGLASVIWSVSQGAVVTALAIADLETAKAAYIASRQARGLSVRPELYDALFSPSGLIGVLGVVILINAVVALLLLLSRRYFDTGRSIMS
jgi:hypothetical protein